MSLGSDVFGHDTSVKRLFGGPGETHVVIGSGAWSHNSLSFQINMFLKYIGPNSDFELQVMGFRHDGIPGSLASCVLQYE